jgi:soluble lytic murein transglycosylase-like protein
MKLSITFPMACLTAAVALSAGQDRSAAGEATASQQKAMASQRQAIAAMEPSLAAQRASFAKQTGQNASSLFFLLAPPAAEASTMPATAACEALPASEMKPIIDDAARKEGLSPDLLYNVARQESGFRPCAVSPKGALGVMQLMPATARQLGVEDPFDPRESVDAGAKLLKTLLNTYGSLPLALGAYNAGPNRIDQAGGLPDIDETTNYVMKILSSLPSDANRK